MSGKIKSLRYVQKWASSSEDCSVLSSSSAQQEQLRLHNLQGLFQEQQVFLRNPGWLDYVENQLSRTEN